jgi:threonine/homoserine/homoserine lactone efflux protein
VSTTALAVVWIVAAVALVVIIRHHAGYLRRARRLTFGAFLETAGWIIVLLVAVAAAFGGLAHPGTRVVEIASAVVGVLFIVLGGAFR